MKLHINGKESVFSLEQDRDGLSLSGLVESLGMKPDRVAVELNRKIIARDHWPETMLSDGDRLEIVQFVGGG